MRTPRSNSRLSMSSRNGGSRASDEDGKTAVKVAVRVRPPLKPTDPGYELIPQRFQRSMVHVTSPTSVAVDVPQGRKLFVFDRVFPETVEQDGIWEYLSESVSSFVQGYNVSILAYGQSGAGKSYTMGTAGPSEQSQPSAMGIIPRAAQALFEKLDGTKHTRNSSSSTGLRTPQRYSMSSASSFARPTVEKNWQLKATYVEIYNEQLRDLLLPDSMSTTDRSAVAIREDAKGRILLTGLHQVNINSVDDLIGALNHGSTIRQTDSTAINAKSSRSHAVFSLNLVQKKTTLQPMSPKEKRMSMPLDPVSGGETVTVDSKLHFVDLAGSERMKNTGASGERAREGISINAGLAALGKVISQLSSRQSGSHVSYRDSKLTRLLQDSLGGNALTYMIACVTPAEFHLSETLNTVQYAQRARAIQSKPRIQQVADESDKQALIDRLKAEVAFLRQQIRNAESSDRRETSVERGERKSEQVLQLQNQLLDTQESYNALSQRHTKLISQLANESTAKGEVDTHPDDLGKSSIERIQRSKSFAESVEQVVVEYEKTIQALESSLSDTRASLATTESTLLERESKCTYVETVNSQLQSRLQKLLDREASTESYLHELESKLDGASTGEEKHATIVDELRKELSRARENEVGCEEYISTLEDRLAEADQDMEMMTREVIRLEHVIQRQRGLGALDNLLHDLDTRHDQKSIRGQVQPDGSESLQTPPQTKAPHHKHTPSLDVLNEASETAIPESDEDLAEPIPEADEDFESEEGNKPDLALEAPGEDLKVLESVTNQLQARRAEAADADPIASPAQSKFVVDKLETVTQELFELRLSHENTLSEYESLEAKYEEALKALSEMQRDKAHQARQPASAVQNELSRPVSFLGETTAPTSKSGAQHSFSQSLSSELSSGAESPRLRELSEDPHHDGLITPASPVGSTIIASTDSEEADKMRKVLAEHQADADRITQRYAELQVEHEEMLALVEKLKAEAEAQRQRSTPPTTPGFKMIRRMTSQSLLSGVDRAHRSLTALRNIAQEELSGKPEVHQHFEANLDVTMHELSSRMERLQSLEAENQNVKKEMEMKATIISGLTRERSSLQGASSIDMGLVTQLRDQVVSQENQIQVLRDAHETRERQLLAEIENLKALLKSQEVATRALDAGTEEQDKKINALEGELTEWRVKHKTALESLQASEHQLTSTLAELESSLAVVETLRSERSVPIESASDPEAIARALDMERERQQELVDGLKRNIEEHQSTISTHMNTIRSLEKSQADLQDQLLTRSVATNPESGGDMARISELEQEISVHRSTIADLEDKLVSLENSHRRELDELEQQMRASLVAERTPDQTEKDAEHEKAMASLHKEIADSRDELVNLLKAVSSLLDADVTSATLPDQIQDVLTQKQHFSEKYAELMDSNEHLRQKAGTIDELTQKHVAQEAKVNELALLVATLEDSLRQKDEQVKKKEALVEEIMAEKEKSVRLVEELEEQMTKSFDQHHNRLSIIQQERDQALEDAKAKIIILERDIETYRVRIEQLELQLKNGTGDISHDRSSSLTSNLRKSASAASLPSPPPAIPLPPLPTIASATNGSSSVSPPNSRHASRELVSAQIVEDQEARIRTIEKHLYAEKQLTATLEEALGDLETQSNKVKTDCESWKKKAWALEDELASLRKERNSARLSLQAVEEERSARKEAEAARAQLEERMNALNKKKKKSTLNCF
ncbi:hypothetical protein POX_d05436 [Penicillium oxalicum]|uniref:hypothetical protein n=1 Tax=Penicillium oxalicum TaxID=69781 RepID=UPI0020B8402A|nr:hypothetical protein POX_d05436 [Penicillium oxalicum]KAI2789936.1 hypothetical protein POX_d05436 [Penicillium oxalicum]